MSEVFGSSAGCGWAKSKEIGLRSSATPDGSEHISAMRTTIDSYKTRAGRLDTAGLDFDAFKDRPLSPEALRSLCYMHDIEHHTVCYLRDLLLTPAHRDPQITSFLACWAFEELWHGEAIARVLQAHGEPAGTTRVAVLRDRRRWRDTFEMLSHLGASALASRSFIALHMSWGAVNEWTTQTGYARLGSREGHPVLSDLFKRIMKQEGGHIDFYASEASRRLAEDTKAQRLTRLALGHLWRPVGSGVMPRSEVAFLCRFLFEGPAGRAAAERIDRLVDRLPGQQGLSLLTRAIDRFSAFDADPGPSRATSN